MRNNEMTERDWKREILKDVIDADTIDQLKLAYSHYMVHLVEEVEDGNRDESMLNSSHIYSEMRKIQAMYFKLKKKVTKEIMTWIDVDS